MKKLLLFTLLILSISCYSQTKEPPGYFEILKWYWTGFPKVHNGWKVEFTEVMYMHGYTEGIKSDIVNVTCDTCGYLEKYSYNISFCYGYKDEASLIVTQNRDSTDKYFKIEYPYFPNSIETKKDKLSKRKAEK